MTPGRTPRPEEVRAARERASLSPRQAADLVFVSERLWLDFEAGSARMSAASWAFFLIAPEQQPVTAYVERYRGLRDTDK
jgi:hypothetical protein